MAKKILPEFESNEDPEWAQAAYIDALEREVAGREARLAELESMGVRDDSPEMEGARGDLKAAKDELARFKPKPKAKK